VIVLLEAELGFAARFAVIPAQAGTQ